jgi:hypothetical protein
MGQRACRCQAPTTPTTRRFDTHHFPVSIYTNPTFRHTSFFRFATSPFRKRFLSLHHRRTMVRPPSSGRQDFIYTAEYETFRYKRTHHGASLQRLIHAVSTHNILPPFRHTTNPRAPKTTNPRRTPHFADELRGFAIGWNGRGRTPDGRGRTAGRDGLTPCEAWLTPCGAWRGRTGGLSRASFRAW